MILTQEICYMILLIVVSAFQDRSVLGVMSVGVTVVYLLFKYPVESCRNIPNRIWPLSGTKSL